MSATDELPRLDAPAPPLLSAGDVVAERYRVEARIGEGGMGVVYRVEHTHLRKQYALKVLRPEWSSSREVVARFEREAIAVGRIESPHVVAATDFGRLDDGSFFLVMEYYRGRTLRGVLERGALPIDRALHVLQGLVTALDAAHAVGIVHRDVKPENVMLVERDGDPDYVKVLDFGVAKADALPGGPPTSGTTALTRAGVIMGTLEYMSPEQACGQAVDARSDLYSAGVILFEMLAGQCPFRGNAGTLWRQHVVGDVPELPAEVAARVDPRLGGMLRRMLATAPDNRFENAAEVLAALEDLSSAPESPGEHTAPRPQPEPVGGPAMPLAMRLWAVVRARLREARAAARTILARREALLRHVTRRRLALCFVVVIMAIVAVVRGTGQEAPREPARGALRAADPVAVVSPENRTPPSVDPAAGATDAPLVNLPPPPAPASAKADEEDDEPPPPASSNPPPRTQSKARQTGPGGIYVPPPSQWFH
jgi:tRNA A-37 threonylcarbamoyl transferase component Bud32